MRWLALGFALSWAASPSPRPSAPAPAGSVCTAEEECLDTEYCSRFNVCRPRKHAGEYCTGDNLGDQQCLSELICDQRDRLCVVPVNKCGTDANCNSTEYCDIKGTKDCYPRDCYSDLQCSERYFCRLNGRTGTCTVQAQQGEACGAKKPCDQGLRCRSGKCERTEPLVCGDFANCWSCTGSGFGSCVYAGGNCVAADSCGGRAKCVTELADCPEDSTSPSGAAASLACTRETDCEIGFYCKGGDPRFVKTGVCTRWGQEGDKCNDEALCARGQLCVKQSYYGDSGLCIPFQQTGYAKVRPGSAQYIAEGHPPNRTEPGYGNVDAGSLPVWPDGRMPDAYRNFTPIVGAATRNPPTRSIPRPPSKASRPKAPTRPVPTAKPKAPTQKGTKPTLAPTPQPSPRPTRTPPEDVPRQRQVNTNNSTTVPRSGSPASPTPFQSVWFVTAPSVGGPLDVQSQFAPVPVAVPLPLSQLGPIGMPAPAQTGPCCPDPTATCLSCRLQMSVSAFCAANPTVRGCEGIVTTPIPAPIPAPISAPLLPAASIPSSQSRIDMSSLPSTFAPGPFVVPRAPPNYPPPPASNTLPMFQPVGQNSPAFSNSFTSFPAQPTTPIFADTFAQSTFQPGFFVQQPAGSTTAGPGVFQSWGG